MLGGRAPDSQSTYVLVLAPCGAKLAKHGGEAGRDGLKCSLRTFGTEPWWSE